MNSSRFMRAAFLVVGLLGLKAQGASVTLNAVSGGSYLLSSGAFSSHTVPDTLLAAGPLTPNFTYSTYLVFNVSGVAGNVTAARLDVPLQFDNTNSLSMLDVHDVTSSRAVLDAAQASTSNLTVFNDLTGDSGSTQPYARLSIPAGNISSPGGTPLNQQLHIALTNPIDANPLRAVADINTARTGAGLFALGLYDATANLQFTTTGIDLSQFQLVLTTDAAAPAAPLPSAAWAGLALLGGIGATKVRRRRRDVSG